MKYVGIAISIIFLVIFCILVMTRKYIDDMFHSLRTHVCLTWILAMIMHKGKYIFFICLVLVCLLILGPGNPIMGCPFIENLT